MCTITSFRVDGWDGLLYRRFLRCWRCRVVYAWVVRSSSNGFDVDLNALRGLWETTTRAHYKSGQGSTSQHTIICGRYNERAN